MTIAFTPVSPFRTSGGAIASLVKPLGSPEAATPEPLDLTASDLSNFNVFSDMLTASQAATLGVGAIFSGALNANEQAMYFDAMAFTDHYSEKPGAILGTRWGVGIRVTLRATRIDANASMSFGLVGAAVELGQARARYEIAGIGLGLGAFTQVLGDLSPLEDFSYETYLKLKGPVVKGLFEYIKSNSNDLIPAPVAVSLAQPIDELSSARAIYYAMSRIIKGQSLRDALEESDIELSREVITSAYQTFTGLVDPSAAPSRETRDRARAWFLQ